MSVAVAQYNYMNQYNVKYDVGNKYKNNNGHIYTIIERINGTKHPRKQAKFIIKFDDTNYTTEVFGTAIKNGNIKDRYAKDIYGVACIGNVKKVDHAKEYDVWVRIISRCYNIKDKAYLNYGKNNVTVCDRWLCFEKFIEDLPSIDGYEDYIKKEERFELDKDIKQPDSKSKVYSLNTCMFVRSLDNNNKMNRRTTSIRSDIIGHHKEESLLISDIPQFAKDNNMSSTHYIYKCLRGEIDSYKGWIFEYLQ